MSNTTKSHVIGTYAEVFKHDFLTPGSERYMNEETLAERIAKADKLGLLDEPYVKHEFKYSQESVMKRRRKRELRKVRARTHRGRNIVIGTVASMSVFTIVLCTLALLYVLVESTVVVFLFFLILALGFLIF